MKLINVPYLIKFVRYKYKLLLEALQFRGLFYKYLSFKYYIKVYRHLRDISWVSFLSRNQEFPYNLFFGLVATRPTSLSPSTRKSNDKGKTVLFLNDKTMERCLVGLFEDYNYKQSQRIHRRVGMWRHVIIILQFCLIIYLKLWTEYPFYFWQRKLYLLSYNL